MPRAVWCGEREKPCFSYRKPFVFAPVVVKVYTPKNALFCNRKRHSCPCHGGRQVRFKPAGYAYVQGVNYQISSNVAGQAVGISLEKDSLCFKGWKWGT